MNRRITAVTFNTFRDYFFTPAFFILIILLLIIPFLCSNMSGDGTAEGKFKVFVTYSFLISSIIFTVTNISLSSSSISSEWKTKTLLLLDVKPIKRWEIILGKWFGILAINVVLIICFLLSMTVSSILVSRDLKKSFPEYRNIFTTEVEVFPSLVNGSSEPKTSDKRETYAVPPRESMEWTFKGIRKSPARRTPARQDLAGGSSLAGGSDNLYLSYRFQTSGSEEQKILGYWLLGNPSLAKPFELGTSFSKDKIHRLPVPNGAVSNEGDLSVVYLNIEPTNISVLFSKEDFKILSPHGSYWVNLVRGSVNMLILVTFICSVGLCFSCIVSNLTAVLSTSVLIFISYLHDFVEMMTNSTLAEMQTQQAVGMIPRLSYPMLKFTAFILPPLNEALPHSYIGNFLLLPLSSLVSLFLRIIVFGALPLIIVAIIYLSRRELGIPNE